MSRPIRIEFPNALYHVTSRGDRREAIFEDDDDRRAFLQTLGQVVRQFNWLCYACVSWITITTCLSRPLIATYLKECAISTAFLHR